MSTDDNLPPVIDFASAKEKLVELDVTPRDFNKPGPCILHRRVTVDEQARSMECRDCGAIVDPFDFCFMWAKGAFRVKMWKEEEKARAESIEALKREERNIRARLARLRKKEAP